MTNQSEDGIFAMTNFPVIIYYVKVQNHSFE